MDAIEMRKNIDINGRDDHDVDKIASGNWADKIWNPQG